MDAIKKNKYHVYRLFGQKIRVPFCIEGLKETEGKPDIRVKYGKTPAYIHGVKSRGARYMAAPGNFLLQVDKVARYQVKNGKEIIVERQGQATEKEMELFLLGSAMGALLHQQGKLPLHASAVAVDGGAVIFLGTSGIGKSTLSADLSLKGFPVLADDIGVITFNKDGIPFLQPGIARIKLWEDVMKRVKLASAPLQQIREGIQKYGVTEGFLFEKQALPVKRVYQLVSHNRGDFLIEKIKGIEKFTVLKNNTFRFRFIEGTGHPEKHFQQLQKLAKAVVLKRVTRPRHPFQLEKLSEILEEDWNT